MLLCALAWTTAHSEDSPSGNHLVISDSGCGPDAGVKVPLQMINNTDVTAVQFTITLAPEVSITTILLDSERCTDHRFSISERKDDNSYKVIVQSPTNAPFKGSAGPILYLDLTVDRTAKVGDTSFMTVRDIVMAKANGDNVALSGATSQGVFTVIEKPDFIVTQINPSENDLTPGKTVTVRWTVFNNSACGSKGGWNEVLLFYDENRHKSVTIGKASFTGTLEPYERQLRSMEVTIPDIPGFCGASLIGVNLKPAMKEDGTEWIVSSPLDDALVNLNAVLFASPASFEINEADGSSPVTLRRSGDVDTPLTVSLKSGDTRVAVPSQVTFASGSSRTSFEVTTMPDGKHNDNSTTEIELSAPDYEPSQISVKIEDDTPPVLSASFNVASGHRGDKVSLTVTASHAPASDLVVNILNPYSSILSLPRTVTIPAGQTSATAEGDVIDNASSAEPQALAVKVSATGYDADGQAEIKVAGAELPSLSLTLSRTLVCESDGPKAVKATLVRSDLTDRDVIVNITDDSENGLIIGRRQFRMKAGITRVEFELGPRDNTLVDGDREYTISAAVALPSCSSCGVSSDSPSGYAEANLTVTDDDGKALKLSAPQSFVAEGERVAVTVSTNAVLTSPLTVNLTAEGCEGIELPAQVVIPAGSNSTETQLALGMNDATGDATITVKATAEEHSTGSLYLVASDRTLPDAQVTSFSLAENSAAATDKVTASVTVANTGNATLPEGMPLSVIELESGTTVARMYLPADLAPGASATVTKEIELPETAGSFSFYVQANADGRIRELSVSNNSSPAFDITLTAPFTYELATDKAAYLPGETVTFTGMVKGDETASAPGELTITKGSESTTIPFTADEEGRVSVKWKVASGWAGDFAFSASYPGEKTAEPLGTFSTYGMTRRGASELKYDVVLGETATDVIELVNLSSLPLTGISAEATDGISLSLPLMLAAGSAAEATVTLSPQEATQGTGYRKTVLTVTTAEGLTMPLTVMYRTAKGTLEPSVSLIEANIPKDGYFDYQLAVTNTGRAPSGTVTLDMPGWMSSQKSFGSIAAGETLLIPIRLNYREDMRLNVVRRGNIVVNAANIERGIPVDFAVKAVTDKDGTVKFQVNDEYTYYAEGAPRVKGASIVISGIQNGGEIARGTSDESGEWSVTLPGGYYHAAFSAENHERFETDFIVSPGETVSRIVNLGVGGVEITYDVVETEIEDEYEIRTIAKFETRVPRPVVVITGPQNLDVEKIRAGESRIYMFTLTNHGLIKALDNRITLPESNEMWQWDLLDGIDPFDIPAESSVEIPVRLTRLKEDDGPAARLTGLTPTAKENHPLTPCMTQMEDEYRHLCGTELKDNEAAYRMALKTCGRMAILQTLANSMGMGSSTGPGGDGTGGGPGFSDVDSYRYNQGSAWICDPELAAEFEESMDEALSNVPILGYFYSVENAAANYSINPNVENALAMLQALLGPLNLVEKGLKKIPAVGELLDTVEKYYGEKFSDQVLDALTDIVNNRLEAAARYIDKINERRKEKNEGGSRVSEAGVRAAFAEEAVESVEGYEYSYDFQKIYDNAAAAYIDQALAKIDILNELFGSPVWYDRPDGSFEPFVKKMQESYEANGTIALADVMPFKPDYVTTTEAEALVARINSLKNPETAQISAEKMGGYAAVIKKSRERAEAAGFENCEEAFDGAVADYREALEELTSSKSTCSSVTLEFKQKLCMTRQAFKGTLTVKNKHQSMEISDFRFTPTVIDLEGVMAGPDRFQIDVTGQNGFSGSESWTLAPEATGTASVIYIPTSKAAPDEPELYLFGGEVEYVDPFVGVKVTRTLSAVALEVAPTPQLDLDYFLQRDLYGDDPLTPQAEPVVDGEFALLISNVGKGDARNVMLTTEQPEITDNEKGLKIDFEIVSSSINGGEKTPALGGATASDFGTIEAGSTAYAQWMLRSSLLGHFTRYKVEVTHLTGHGNPDLSLLNRVDIHELIRSIDGNDGLTGWLVNDYADKEDTPDNVIFSDGTTVEVDNGSMTVVSLPDNRLELTVNPTASGWCYAWANDPGYGTSRILSAEGDTPERNVWLTDRVLRDGKDPLYENRIHAFVYSPDGSPVKVVLNMEPRPATELKASFIGIPTDTEEISEPIDRIIVRFNKPVDASTFTSDLVTLRVNGETMPADVITIAPSDENPETEFVIGLAEAGYHSGLHVIAVNTAGITARDGYKGLSGTTARWIVGGTASVVTVAAVAAPAEGGSVTPAVVETVPGSVFIFKAAPNEGYDFAGWEEDGIIISTEAELSYTVVRQATLKALFKTKRHTVTLTSSAGGAVNTPSGEYEHGTVLVLNASPASGYRFSHWIVNSVKAGSDNPITLTVDRPLTVHAVFAAVTTSIDAIAADPDSYEIYDLAGRRLRRIEHSGLYIVNGQKTFVR